MTASIAAATVLVGLLTVVVASETAMSGVAIMAALPGRATAWRVLGPVPLLATVWLVVLVAWVQTAFPATETAVWTDAWAPAGTVALAAAFRLALVLAGPVVPPVVTRVGLAATAVVTIVGWPLLAVGVGRLDPWEGWFGAGILGLLAVTAGSVAVRRGRWAIALGRPAPVALLSGAAIAIAAVGVLQLPTPVRTPSADPATLQLLATAGALTLPMLTVLQILTVRLLRTARGALGWTAIASFPIGNGEPR